MFGVGKVFLIILKEMLTQFCIRLIKNRVKTVILSNIIAVL